MTHQTPDMIQVPVTKAADEGQIVPVSSPEMITEIPASTQQELGGAAARLASSAEPMIEHVPGYQGPIVTTREAAAAQIAKAVAASDQAQPVVQFGGIPRT